MLAQRYIETISDDGFLHIDIGKPRGTRVEVIVLDINEDQESVALAAMQERTGFALNVLSNPQEDVWNDL
jgi:hypothetical protein